MRDTLTIDGAKVPRRVVIESTAELVAATIGKATATQYREGAAWYLQAYGKAAELGAMLGLPDSVGAIRAGADIIAILSPACAWEHNVQVAELVALGVALEDITYQGYANFLERAIEYRTLAVSGKFAEARALVRGPKVNSFSNAICDPLGWSDPVIDRHIVGLLGWARPKSLENAGVYDAVARGIRLAAYWLGLSVHACQAIAWAVVRPEPRRVPELQVPY